MMGSESKAGTNFGAGNNSVMELVSMLRSSFQQKEFDRVQRILMSREEDMKRKISEMALEIENWRRLYDLMEKKHGEFKLEIQDELKKRERDCDELEEKMSRLNSDIKVLRDRAKRNEERYSRLFGDFTNAESDKREMILQLECSKAAKRRAEGEAESSKKKFEELEFRVLRLEEDAAMLMREEPLFQKEMDQNVGAEMPVPDQNIEKKEKSENVKSQNGTGIGNGSSKLTRLQNLGRAQSFHDQVHTLPPELENKSPQAKGTEPIKRDSDIGMSTKKELDFEVDSTDKLMGLSVEGNKRFEARDIIEITDSDDDDEMHPVHETAHDPNICPSGVNMNGKEAISQRVEKSADLGNTGEEKSRSCKENSICDSKNKRKRSSFSIISENGKSDDDRTSIGKRKIKAAVDNSPLKYVLNETWSCNCEDSSGDETCASSSYMDYMVSQITRKRGSTERWPFESDLLSALQSDPELCMDAICVLYRQQNSMKGSLVPKNRGFNVLDTLRGTKLAKFLTDGDPQGKLKKSVSELQQYDPKGLDDCKKFATRYYKQLFEIYRKKEDRFFPTCNKL